jgi:hypothetical protein
MPLDGTEAGGIDRSASSSCSGQSEARTSCHNSRAYYVHLELLQARLIDAYSHLGVSHSDVGALHATSISASHTYVLFTLCILDSLEHCPSMLTP